MKIQLPQHLKNRAGARGKTKTCTVNEVEPFLPKDTCFFDIRHLVYGIDILPFSVTTKINANQQQFLKEMEDKQPTMIHKCGDRNKNQYSESETAFTIPANPMSDTVQMVKESINTDKDGNSRTINAHYECSNMDSFTRKSCDGYGYIRTGVKEQIHINTTDDGMDTTLTKAHHYSGNIVNQKRGQKEMGIMEKENGKRYRIRKLTERECFRLMGVDDKDTDTIQSSGVSRSAQYKLAGNSIVVDVLYHIFRKAFVETENESRQLTLF